MTDEQLERLHRGGHDPAKIYNAYKRAMEHKGGPTVILAKTVKGYGMGSSQARNATHNEKKLTDCRAGCIREAVRHSYSRGGGDAWHAVSSRAGRAGDRLHAAAAPGTGRLSAEARGAEAGLQGTGAGLLCRVDGGSNKRAVSTTMGFVSILRHLMKDPDDRQADRADRAGRRPHLRPGIGDPAGRHLRSGGPEVSAARHGHAAVLPRGAGRADSGRRHYRGRLDGVVYRRGHGVRELQGADDSLLHVLLDVRIPAHRRHGVGLCGLRAARAS